MVKSQYVRRHLRGSVTGAHDTFTQETIQVPIDASRNVGVVIREVKIETVPGASMSGDADSLDVQVTNKSQSAIVRISDESVIEKFSFYANGAAVLQIEDLCKSKILKPPAPIFNQEIYLGVHADFAGAGATVHYDIIYDVAYFQNSEMMSLMKQHLL